MKKFVIHVVLIKAAFVSITILCSCFTANAANSVHFTFAQPARGEIITMSLNNTMDVRSTIFQAGQSFLPTQNKVNRIQQRTVELISPGAKVQQGYVTFIDSHKISWRGGKYDKTDKEPIIGKKYLVSRVNDKIIVSYPDGTKPTDAELKLVSASMESFGKSNPLARVLNGRTITIGQKIELPIEDVRDMFGFVKSIDRVSQFKLSLTSIEHSGSHELAVFDVGLVARGSGEQDVAMNVLGTITIDPSTTRVTKVQLHGPVNVSHRQGPAGHTYLVTGSGSLTLGMAAKYTLAPAATTTATR